MMMVQRELERINRSDEAIKMGLYSSDTGELQSITFLMYVQFTCSEARQELK